MEDQIILKELNKREEKRHQEITIEALRSKHDDRFVLGKTKDGYYKAVRYLNGRKVVFEDDDK